MSADIGKGAAGGAGTEILPSCRSERNDTGSILCLQSCLDSGMITSDEVLELVMKSKKAQIKSIHPYAFTPPKDENGRWQTTYKGPDGKRRSIRGRSEDELLQKLIPIYFEESHIDKMTFDELFEEWLKHKENLASPNTIVRHRQHFRKYLLSSRLHDKKIRSIDELLMEEECNRIVREFNLSKNEWTNLKTILKGCFDFAIRKKYLTVDPTERLKISVKFRQVNKKTGKTETYNSEELALLNSYLDRMYAETSDTIFMAVRLNFLIGLRVGELTALRWEDYDSICRLHVVREEIRNQITGKLEIAEHTKTNRDRFVTLVPKAISILQNLPHDGEYIFMRNGQRITSRQINYVLEKFAERQGWAKAKSSHKMRKTYASLLNAAGVPLDEIREQLGHSNLNTTLGYIYNPLTDSETYKLMTEALEPEHAELPKNVVNMG